MHSLGGFHSIGMPGLVIIFLIALMLFGPWGLFGPPRGPFSRGPRE